MQFSKAKEKFISLWHAHEVCMLQNFISLTSKRQQNVVVIYKSFEDIIRNQFKSLKSSLLLIFQKSNGKIAFVGIYWTAGSWLERYTEYVHQDMPFIQQYKSYSCHHIHKQLVLERFATGGAKYCNSCNSCVCDNFQFLSMLTIGQPATNNTDISYNGQWSYFESPVKMQEWPTFIISENSLSTPYQVQL